MATATSGIIPLFDFLLNDYLVFYRIELIIQRFLHDAMD